MLKHALRSHALFLITALSFSIAFADPAPSRSVYVTVINKCDIPIIFNIDNNWGSRYSGNYTLQKTGSTEIDTNGQKYQTDRSGFIFNSNNDKEVYTLSYQSAVCHIDYPLIRDNYFLNATISGCNKMPSCRVS